MEKILEHILPLMGVEHDCILSKMGDVTLAYRVELPEIFSLSDQEYETLHQSWVRAIRALPARSILCKQDWYHKDRFKADFGSGAGSVLQRSSELHFNERPFLSHQCYLFLTKTPAQRKSSSSMLSTLVRGNLVPTQTMDEKGFADFFDSCGQFQRILEDSGLIQLHRLGEQDLLSDKEKMGIIERYCFLRREDSPVEFCDMDLTGAELKIGDQYCQLYTLGDARELPPLCGSRIDYGQYSTEKSKFSIGFSSPLGLLLNCNHLYSQYIFVMDAQKTIQRLERKRLRLQSLSTYSRENMIARDATNEFLNEAISLQRLPVKAHFNVLAWTNQPEELPQIKNMVSSALAKMDAMTKLETVGAPQIFWAGIPGNSADFPMNDSFDTFAEQASCMLNMETLAGSSSSPVGIRLGDRLSGRPLHVDISDEPMVKGICTNRNKFILGPSGSGKSFFTNHLIRTYIEQGSHVVLVDVGHSYKGLCDLIKGYYFTYDQDHPIRFNPFFIGQGDCLDTEKKESIKTLLLALWKKDDETFRRSEYVALSNAITGYYEHLETHRELFACFNSFYEYLRQEYVAILEQDRVKERDFDVDNFLYVLRPYYRSGEFDYLLNATENLDLLQERFIVFELDNIKEHPILFPVVTIIIMEVFVNKMRRKKGIRKVILIEEAWKALMKEGFAQYIQYLFKTVRKFYGEAIVVTQDVEDIISSPIVKQAIINNSDCKILLDQRKYQNKFDQIQQLLALSDKEKALVLSVNRSNEPTGKYKEVFISLGGMLSRVYRTEVSTAEYLTYTTEQSERLKLQEYLDSYGGDMKKAVTSMAMDIENGNLKL